jgi:predicted site-specific integrase-resolvase
MKLSDYAKHLGISYQTAWRWWKAGKLPHPARQVESGTVIVDFVLGEDKNSSNSKRAAIYARVSSSENKDNLDRQAERLSQYATAKGYQVVRVVKEVGSGLSDSRKKLESLLLNSDYDVLVAEHRDRIARFGLNYIGILLGRLGVQLEIVNLPEEARDDLMEDLVSIIVSFTARLYGQRRAKRKTEKIIAELHSEAGEE